MGFGMILVMHIHKIDTYASEDHRMQETIESCPFRPLWLASSGNLAYFVRLHPHPPPPLHTTLKYLTYLFSYLHGSFYISARACIQCRKPIVQPTQPHPFHSSGIPRGKLNTRIACPPSPRHCQIIEFRGCSGGARWVRGWQ